MTDQYEPPTNPHDPPGGAPAPTARGIVRDKNLTLPAKARALWAFPWFRFLVVAVLSWLVGFSMGTSSDRTTPSTAAPIVTATVTATADTETITTTHTETVTIEPTPTPTPTPEPTEEPSPEPSEEPSPEAPADDPDTDAADLAARVESALKDGGPDITPTWVLPILEVEPMNSSTVRIHYAENLSEAAAKDMGRKVYTFTSWNAPELSTVVVRGQSGIDVNYFSPR